VVSKARSVKRCIGCYYPIGLFLNIQSAITTRKLTAISGKNITAIFTHPTKLPIRSLMNIDGFSSVMFLNTLEKPLMLNMLKKLIGKLAQQKEKYPIGILGLDTMLFHAKDVIVGLSSTETLYRKTLDLDNKIKLIRFLLNYDYCNECLVLLTNSCRKGFHAQIWASHHLNLDKFDDPFRNRLHSIFPVKEILFTRKESRKNVIYKK